MSGALIKDQEVTIDNGKVTGYKVILMTFILSIEPRVAFDKFVDGLTDR
jgi:hypothetical protein